MPPSIEQYCIILPRRGVGFFSQFLQVIGTLAILEPKNPKYTSIAYFNHLFTYWSREGYNGRTNGWDYYFEPLSGSRLHEVIGIDDQRLQLYTHEDFAKLKFENIYFSSDYWSQITGAYGDMTEAQKALSARITNHYVRLNASVKKKLDEVKGTLFGSSDVIGVHFRSTDKGSEITGCLKFPFLGPEHYQSRVDQYLDGHPGACIFLATDWSEILNQFKSRYGKRLLYTSASRSDLASIPPHSSADPKMGEEVLIETLLLSSCKHMVHGISNVSAAALCFNPDLPHDNVYRRHIDLRAMPESATPR